MTTELNDKSVLYKLLILIAVCIGTAAFLCGCDDDKPVELIVTKAPISVNSEIDKEAEDDAVTVTDGDGESYDPSGDETEDITEDGSEKENKEDEDTEDTEETENADEGDTGEEDDNEEDSGEEEDTKTEAASAVPGSVENVGLNGSWQFAGNSAINSGSAKLYRAADNRKGVVIAVNAGHGTKGGQSVKTLCHPDGSPKVTGGSTGAGSIKATAVSGGMSFADGASEASVTLREAQILRDILLSRGYDVLMLRDDSDVQLDNIARTVIANNTAACHIAIHWDGDNLAYDKGCFYISTPDGIKGMDPVSSHWQQHEALGQSLIAGLAAKGCKIYKGGSMAIDLTQTSYSTIPSVDIELGNAASAHDDGTLNQLAQGLADGISAMF